MSIELITQQIDNIEPFQFSKTSSIEVEYILKNNIKNGKASGVDGVPARAIKDSAPIFCYVLAMLFNSIVSLCEFPTDLKRGAWTPVFKGGSRTDVSRYRPVTVLSHTAKVMETLMTHQFSKHVLPLLSPYQFAYKKNHGTETALLYLVESWKSAIEARKTVGIMSLDLTAAFDCIPHGSLLIKLGAYGMSDSSLKLMKSYLSSRHNCIRLHGKQSDQWFEVLKGIPQGSQWGPLIWNVYLNDLLPMIRSYGAEVIAYADDITV